MKYSILLLISFLFLSCSDNQITNPKSSPLDEATSGVKNKIYYPSLESNQILSIEAFEYGNGQLQKKIYYGDNRDMIYHYELFNYDNSEKLSYKLNYYNNTNSPTGFILLDSTIYLYSNDLLMTEITNYLYANYFDKYSYEYDGEILIKKSKYDNDELESYITYEYKNGKLSKEINHYKNNTIVETREYSYKNIVLTKVVYYDSRGNVKRIISYGYNNKGKLIWEKVDELFIYSSSLPYVVRYVY